MALSNVIEIVDRSIFESLYRVCVENGYTVDRTIENVLVDEDIWKAQEQLIIEDKGFVIEVFGHSNSHEKGRRSQPRLTYIPERLLPGDIGNSVSVQHIPNGGSFNSTRGPTQTSNYTFKIILDAIDAQQMRLLQSIVASACPKRGYIKFYTDIELVGEQTDRFLVNQFGYSDSPDNVKGVLSASYMYRAYDLFEYDPVDLDQTIAPISNIEVYINGNSTLDIDGE